MYLENMEADGVGAQAEHVFMEEDNKKAPVIASTRDENTNSSQVACRA
jgi:hypothetical protein